MIYAGVFLSDIVGYYLGSFVARGKLKLKFISSILSHRYTKKLRKYMEKHGQLTFIVCRFIPFGVRPTLFMSSGFFGMKFRRFLVYDLVASLISVNTLFWLVFYFGESVEKPLHIIGIVLFVILALTISQFIARIIYKFIRRKSKNKNKPDTGTNAVCDTDGVSVPSENKSSLD